MSSRRKAYIFYLPLSYVISIQTLPNKLWDVKFQTLFLIKPDILCEWPHDYLKFAGFFLCFLDVVKESALNVIQWGCQLLFRSRHPFCPPKIYFLNIFSLLWMTYVLLIHEVFMEKFSILNSWIWQFKNFTKSYQGWHEYYKNNFASSQFYIQHSISLFVSIPINWNERPHLTITGSFLLSQKDPSK